MRTEADLGGPLKEVGWIKRLRTSPRYSRIFLLTLSITHFVDDGLFKAISILIPFIKSEFNLSYFNVGMLETIRSLASSIGNPVFGYITDRSGKIKEAMVLGVFGFFLGIVLIGFSRNFIDILFLLFVASISSCIYHPQAISLLNLTFKEKLHSAIGVHGAIGAIGLVSCPILMSYSSLFYGWRFSALLVFLHFF